MGLDVKTRRKRFVPDEAHYFQEAFRQTLEELKLNIDAEVESNLRGGMVDERTGQLADDGWRSEVVLTQTGWRLVYSITSEIGVIIHEGVPYAWTIEAPPGQVLRWKDENGEWRFAVRVTHPAMPPRPFIRQPFRRWQRHAGRIFKRHLQ